MELEQHSEKKNRGNQSPDKQKDFGKSFDMKKSVYMQQRKFLFQFLLMNGSNFWFTFVLPGKYVSPEHQPCEGRVPKKTG